MRDQRSFLSRPGGDRFATAAIVLGLAALAAAGCAGSGGRRAAVPGPGSGPTPPVTTHRPVPVALEPLAVFENVRDAPYYPFAGLAGAAFYADGTFYVCDEKGGRVLGYDPSRDDWFQFDTPGGRFFRPLDVKVDQFSVLVLDADGRQLLRYDLSGAFRDRLVDFTYLDPARDRLPVAFAVDGDGRVAVCDAAEDQVLLLDPYLNLHSVVGESGSHREQFREPSGIAFLRDGGFVVADRGNRRLELFNRLGVYMAGIGGEFAPHNAMVAPTGVAVDPDGNIFVADPVAGAVLVYAPDGRLLLRAGQEMGLAAGPLNPVGLALGPDDRLVVTDRGREAVLLYRVRYSTPEE